ncbi:hypothetical protein LTR56_024918 [Elasticomyces elasticus]|nr:hypothetical protein LTR56_024918 [Elasticomyces elasticus]KAK3641678.1 hypothetical protein LTR22_016496 [Elasticomyces elasticus]KAK4907972.1 hypothetical protein LTR49_023070 [Elasticomyces elasticus]KAK5741836.1 hypothetical protein LTS12_024472 [Elasticomyces elasticus]
MSNASSHANSDGSNDTTSPQASALDRVTTARLDQPHTNGHNTTGKLKNEPTSNDDDRAKPKERLPAKLKRIWLAKTGIDQRTYMQLFKGALAPTIAISAYQSTAWSQTYTTIGYLVGIMTILSLPITPRAKFLQTMCVNVFVVCLGCAVALLAMYCTVSARISTEGRRGSSAGGATSGLATGGAPTSTYNSSASAVAGVWLFVQIYAISAYRANRPQFTIPAIMLAIFANVSMIYAPQFSSMVQAQAFAQRLLEAFLTGFAISTGVSLLVFPLTSREIVFKSIAGYIASLRGSLDANLAYLQSLEDSDMFAPHRVNTAGDEVIGSKEADALKAKVQALLALHAKLSVDLPFAKREVAIGKVGPDDLQDITKRLRQVLVPIVGLSSMSDLFQRIAEGRGWDRNLDLSQASAEEVPQGEKVRFDSIQAWHHLMKTLHGPYNQATQAIKEGLQHVAITLQLAPQQAARQADDAVESAGDEPAPGEKGFAAYYERRSNDFANTRKIMLRSWCEVHGIELPQTFFDDPYQTDFEAPGWMNGDPMSLGRQQLRRQLFVCLHLAFLLWKTNRTVYELMLFVDGLAASGKLSKTRLIVPGFKRLRKWAMSLFAHDNEAHDDQQIDSGSGVPAVYLGEAYKKRKDPEHLPPQTAWERSSNMLRIVGHFFASPESAFGFRCACATMSIAVVAYLSDTQTFFTRERLFWSQIMISISMSPTAGQSVRGFVLRVFGTFVAMVVAFIAYYIVDGHTAGILVFYFFFLHGGVYIVSKYPKYIPVVQVTLTLILGYELQVRKVGIQTAISNGQAYFPIYELAPIRLATVCGGLFLAWIWTIFPYPITEHSQLRQNLGRSLYLLANYYSIMHETVRARLRGSDGSWTTKGSPTYQLDKSRHKIFLKCSSILTGLRAQSGFVKFDIPIGGPFPRQQYQEIIALMQSTLNYMALVSLASTTFTELQEKEERNEHNSEWLRNFRKLISQANVTSEAVTTLLSLLSASVSSGSPLPPYLRVPEPYQLSQRLDEMDKDILSVRHIAEPGYSSFAVIQIGTRCVIDDLRKLLALVKELVGELDFSYHVVSTTDATRNNSSETLLYKGDDATAEKKID